MDDENNRQRQQDEIEVMKCIYPDTFSCINGDWYLIQVENDLGRPPLELRIRLHDGYPSRGPPSYEVYAEWLSPEQISDIVFQLSELFDSSCNEVVMYTWTEWLKEHVIPTVLRPEDVKHKEGNQLSPPSLPHNDDDDDGDDGDDGDGSEGGDEDTGQMDSLSHSLTDEQCERGHQPTKSKQFQNSDSTSLTIPQIFSDEPFTERKSTFQAHCAEVHSIHDVHAVLQSLYTISKIQKATHNMYAYRIFDEQRNVWIQDNDDDGESAAGSRMQHLMSILEVKNVMIVVSRWFGGILLGPDRFKHINNATRNALEKYGYLNHGNEKSSKTGKK